MLGAAGEEEVVFAQLNKNLKKNFAHFSKDSRIPLCMLIMIYKVRLLLWILTIPLRTLSEKNGIKGKKFPNGGYMLHLHTGIFFGCSLAITAGRNKLAKAQMLR